MPVKTSLDATVQTDPVEDDHYTYSRRRSHGMTSITIETSREMRDLVNNCYRARKESSLAGPACSFWY